MSALPSPKRHQEYEFAPGVTCLDCGWAERFQGRINDLIAAELICSEWIPGQSSTNKVMQRVVFDGDPLLPTPRLIPWARSKREKDEADILITRTSRHRCSVLRRSGAMTDRKGLQVALNEARAAMSESASKAGVSVRFQR